MREEEEANWFARWEEQLPSPEELMPLSQNLITPDLALAFDIPTIRSNPNPNPSLHHHHPAPTLHPPPPAPSSQPAPDFDSPDHLTTASSGGGAGGGGAGEEPARTLKRPRLVWTPQLHKRFVDAVAHLGIKNAVPKTIMQLMGVEGLTRENVASHLQKYRLYLKRMQQSSSSSASATATAALAGGRISAADHQLFASGPVPHHFLSPRGVAGPDPPFVPLVRVNPLHHHHHHHQIGQQYYYQRQMGHFGSATSGGVGGGGGGFDYRFLSPPPIGMQHMGMGMGMGFPRATSSYGEQLESGERGGGRMELTLFPKGDD